MKIAYLTANDPLDPRAWSGILLFMYKALERHCGEVVSLGPAGQKLQMAGKATAKAARLLFGHNVDSIHTLILSKSLARTFNRLLAAAEFDVIFAPAASTELAYLETKLPVAYYGDLTAKLFSGYAANVRGLSNWSLKQMEQIERRALTRADHLAYASQWAANSAMNHYAVPREKISVIPMAANLDDIPAVDDIKAARQAGPSRTCRLLFIGVDWERKGGDVALAAMRELRTRGIDASLTVVGCSPPAGVRDRQLQVIPFLNKSVPEQRKRLNNLFMSSDFMLFPTRREAFGVVCCEANAFGLPLIASNGGGLPVWNGENGILLAADAPPDKYADVVQNLIADPEQYRALAMAGRKMFESRLNWDAWGKAMANILERIIQKPPSSKHPKLNSTTDRVRNQSHERA
ncbi:MAG TPA: glycosyltransferase family 4 protein [Candidatus Angelobacter sp.]|nr:glycosyltransferase family 4 protein [Candidatus Angelobacter sp.]